MSLNRYPGWLCMIAALSLAAGCGGGGDSGVATAGENRNASAAAQANHFCGAIPERPWCNASLPPDTRADLLVAAMTREQKLGMLAGDDLTAVFSGIPYTGIVQGIPALGIPDIRMSDGPAGVRGGPATAMPTPMALAATFNPDLAYATGVAIAEEVRHKGNNLVHGPVADVIRNPLSGRTFETFGEDPVLASRMVAEWVKGAQSQGVMANVKHFAAYVQEGILPLVPLLLAAVGDRHLYNAVVSERALREIYLPPFRAAVVGANAASVMCAYNYVNGEPACSNSYLLDQVLHDDWGFTGFVVTDYILAQKNTIKTANTDVAVIEMPIGVFFHPLLLKTAMATGAVSAATINAHVHDILYTLFRFGFFDRPPYERNKEAIDFEAHAEVAREVITQGTVLLKNAGMLPLDENRLTNIAVIGASATEIPSGGGSSHVTPVRVITPLEGITQRAGPNIDVRYNDGSNIDAAAALAARSDMAIVFASDVSAEGMDKFCLSLDCTLADLPDSLLLNAVGHGVPDLLDRLLDPLLTSPAISALLAQLTGPILVGAPLLPVSHRAQGRLIAAVAAANPATTVVLQTSGPVLTPWRDKVNAILEAWYPGQEAGYALAAILFGDTVPGGRLPVTFPAAETDTPVAGNPARYPGILNQVHFSEGIFIGYRWFDENHVEPAYPFGYGLSYTNFEYSHLVVANDNSGLSVSIRVNNVGDRGGWAVPQLYVGLPSPQGVPQPPKALKGFEKLWLEPGEVRTVHFALDQRALSYWHTGNNDWVVAPGCYRIMVGRSSRDLPLQSAVPMAGGGCGS